MIQNVYVPYDEWFCPFQSQSQFPAIDNDISRAIKSILQIGVHSSPKSEPFDWKLGTADEEFFVNNMCELNTA